MNLYEYMLVTQKCKDHSVLTKQNLSEIMTCGTEEEKQAAIDEMLAEGYENLEDE